MTVSHEEVNTMVSTGAVDDSEVGLIEDSANGPENDDTPPDDLLNELAVGEFADALGDELPPKKDAKSKPDEVDDDEDEPEDEDQDDEEPEDEEPEDEPEDEPKPKGRAGKRIQKLLDQNREMTASFQRQTAALQSQVREALESQKSTYERQLGEMAQQLQYQHQLLERRAQAEEEKGLSEVEKFRRKTISEAEERAEQRVLQRVTPAIQQLMERFDARERAEAERNARAESQRVLSEYTAKSRMAREKVLLAGIDAGLTDDEMETMDDMLLSYVASKNVAPDVAAAGFRKLVEKLHRGLIKSKTKTAAGKGKKPVPPPAVPGRRPAKEGPYRPSWEALQSAGYDNFIQWRGDGAPRLKEPK